MNKDSSKKPILYILLTAACVGLVLTYSSFSPEDSTWFPKCIFLQLTGLKCPGCGIWVLIDIIMIACNTYVDGNGQTLK